MDFRKASAKDAPGIARAEELIFPDPWTERSVTDLISTEGAMCFVATEEDRVCGYVIGRLIAPEGEIYRVAVLPEYRRRGLAYRLLDYSVKCSLGKGLESLFLEVRSQNIAAISLYTAYGFRKIGIRKNYYKNPTDDAVLMLRASRAEMEYI